MSLSKSELEALLASGRYPYYGSGRVPYASKADYLATQGSAPAPAPVSRSATRTVEPVIVTISGSSAGVTTTRVREYAEPGETARPDVVAVVQEAVVVQEQRVAESWVVVEDVNIEQFREQPTTVSTGGLTAEDQLAENRRLAEEQARIRAAYLVEVANYQATQTLLGEKVREIQVERPAPGIPVAPVSQPLGAPGARPAPTITETYVQAREELEGYGYTPEQVETPISELPQIIQPRVVTPRVVTPPVAPPEPLVEGLHPGADTAFRRLLFLGIIASIAKGLSKG